MAFEESIDPLIATLSDQNADVVAAVEYALVQIGLPAVEQLLAVYHNDGDDLSHCESVYTGYFLKTIRRGLWLWLWMFVQV